MQSAQSTLNSVSNVDPATCNRVWSAIILDFLGAIGNATILPSDAKF